MRVLEENYYELAELSWRIRIGEIDWKPPIHNNPLDYGLTAKDAINSRIRYLRSLLTPIINEFNALKGQYLRGERPYGFIGMNSLQEKIDKLQKAISFNRARLKGDTTHQPFDLEAIKRVPLNQITEILPSGFFKNNPFRQENSPSNSLHWNKKNNTFMDFGSGKFGDSIDLVMAMQSCNFLDACKFLNSMIS